MEMIGAAVGVGLVLGSVIANPLIAAGGAFLLSFATDGVVGLGYDVLFRGWVEGWMLKMFVALGI